MIDSSEIPKSSIKDSIVTLLTNLPEKTRTQSQTLGHLRTDIHKGCVAEIAYNGLLGNWSYDKIKAYMENANIWDLTDDPSFKSNLSLWDAEKKPEYPHYDKLLQHLSDRREEIKIKRSQLTSIALEVSQHIDRPKIIHHVCQDLLGKLHISVEDDLVQQYIDNIQYDPAYPKADTFLNRNKISLATPDHLSPDCLLNEEYLDDDIADIKHEFVHYLRMNGKIKYDIAVPVASAIISLEFLRGGTSQTGWSPKPDEINRIRDVISVGTDFEYVYCRALEIIDVHGTPLGEIIRAHQSEPQNNEPDSSYSRGFRLGILAYALEERAKQRGIDLTADTLLSRLAQGELPGDIVGNELFQLLKKETGI